mgnify:CR=1 FL=1
MVIAASPFHTMSSTPRKPLPIGTSPIPALGIRQEEGQVGVGFLVDSAAVVASAGAGSGYEAWDGTSMAAPHVSGVAALVWSANPAWTNVQIREALIATARDLGDPGRDIHYGYGLVQAYDAWKLLTAKPGK